MSGFVTLILEVQQDTDVWEGLGFIELEQRNGGGCLLDCHP